MRRLPVILLLFVFFTAFVAEVTSCGSQTDTTVDTVPVNTDIPDTLRVATLYGPLSFFLFREDTMGYDYTLLREFAKSKNIALEIEIASSLDKAVAMLDSGLVDLIAYEVPVTSTYRENVYPCGPEIMTSQVLVQRTDSGLVTDVTQLIGREVWVENNSKYQHRLENLNSELGGGIDIRIIDRDTITNEDIIEMVATGELPISVVDSDIARLNKTYYRNIDASVEISFSQKSSWGVSPERAWLGDSISAWFNAEGTKRENELLLKKYFELSKNGPIFNLSASLSKGKVSEYDALFRKHAARIGWDWRLLAAQGYVESQFNNHLVSWAGARGLMQIMPSTARAYGVNPDSLVNPEICIALAADIMQATEKMVARYVDNPEQRQIMTVAAYNSGAAHIIDAIALAKKYGHDPQVWFGNVEASLLLKGDQRYYSDPVVKYGYFRGSQTTQYVHHVYDFYNRIKKHVK